MKFSTSSIAFMGLALASTATQAANFTYTQRDLIVAFTKSGSPDLEINLGSINNYRVGVATPGQVFDFSTGGNQKYDATTQLLGNFGSFSGLTFDAFATQRTTTGGVTGQNNWLWLSNARTDVNTQSTALTGYGNSQSSQRQGAISSVMGDNVASGAKVYAPNANYTTPPASSATALIIPTDANDPVRIHSYTVKSTANGALNSLLPSTIYNTTTTGIVVSDVYELPANTSGIAGTYLGKLTFDGTTGSLSFTAVPEPSTYATLFASALLVGGLWMRNRSQKVQA